MRPLQMVLLGVGAVVVLLLVIGGIAYAADMSVEAEVTKRCQNGVAEITTRLPVPGITRDIEIGNPAQCVAAQEGVYARYHIRTERTSIWSDDSRSVCIWDTAFGPGGCDQ